MPARPSDNVNWNTTDSPANETAPTAGQQASGYSAAGALLSRQLVNWMFNRLGAWQRWLFQSVYRSTDLHGSSSGMFPWHSTPPTTGTGLNQTANSFTARVYVGGYAVGPTSGPAATYTYTAETDTYWDLSRDGVWTPVAVANGDPAPAVTANSVRCWMVVTDTVDRTAVTDYSSTYARIPLRQSLSLDAVDSASNPVDFLLGVAGVQQVPSGTSNYTRLFARQVSGGDNAVSIYWGGSSAFLGEGFYIAVNGYVQGTSTWAESTTANSWLLVLTHSGGMQVLRHVTTGGTWSSAVGSGNWVRIGRMSSSLITDIAAATLGSTWTTGDANAGITHAAGVVASNMQVRARGTISTDGAGNVSVAGGAVNFTSAAITGNRVTFTFATDLGSTAYQVLAIPEYNSTMATGRYATKATGSVQIIPHDAAGSQINPAAVALRFDLIVIG